MLKYAIAMMLVQPIEEIHNCNNPNLKGKVKHYVCDWDQKDFYTNVNNKMRYMIIFSDWCDIFATPTF